jgi:GNAT superfamily N-acetyltransferase
MTDAVIHEIQDSDEKSATTRAVLEALPLWFGVQESIEGYVKDNRALPFFAAYDGGALVGFAAVRFHNEFTAELEVIGVFERYHRCGVGRKLVAAAEDLCRDTGRRFLLVKTLDESAHYEPYDRTRNFYLAQGFVPLQSLKDYWDESNPCLLMAKQLC